MILMTWVWLKSKSRDSSPHLWLLQQFGSFSAFLSEWKCFLLTVQHEVAASAWINHYYSSEFLMSPKIRDPDPSFHSFCSTRWVVDLQLSIVLPRLLGRFQGLKLFSWKKLLSKKCVKSLGGQRNPKWSKIGSVIGSLSPFCVVFQQGK